MKRMSPRRRASRFYRTLTSPLRRLPDFLVIGVVKGGTTSIYKYITQHPQIVSATAKEVHYFKNSYYAKYGQNWYRSHFPLKKIITRSTKLTGEASPEYFHNLEGPQRVSDLIPNAKLVLLLRNPIDRTYSHYAMNMRNRKKKQGLDPQRSFSEQIKYELKILREKRPPTPTRENFEPIAFTYASGGLYLHSLQNWLTKFSKEDLLILKSEDLFSDSLKTVNQVFDFLGLPAYEGKYDVFNAGDRSNMDEETRDLLANFFRPHNELLFEFLGQDFGWNDEF